MGDRKLVSFAPYVPYPAIAHAGGQQYLRHLNTLATLGYDTTVVAPDTKENRAALAHGEQAFRVYLYRVYPSSIFTRVSRRLNTIFTAGRSPWVYGGVLRRDGSIRKLLTEASLVEAQWTETMSLFADVPVLRYCPRPLLCMSHDVITDREQRRLSLVPFWNLPKKVLVLTRIAQARINERRALLRASVTVALSEKDAMLLRRVCWTAQVAHVNPIIEAPSHVSGAPATASVLFVGTLSRTFNVDAALWLLRDIWPLVLDFIPDATLTIAGADPPQELTSLAQSFPSVTVTGFVESLEGVYADASLIVAPVRGGAGVKFKTVEALVRGIPIVSTPIGAEGLESYASDSFAIVSDPREFAAAVVRILNAGDSLDPSVTQTAVQARSDFGSEHYKETISEILATTLRL